MGRVYSVLSAALSTSRVPSLLTATTRSSGTVTSRMVPADVTCVAAPVGRVWPARVQRATTLQSYPACRADAVTRRYGTVVVWPHSVTDHGAPGWAPWLVPPVRPGDRTGNRKPGFVTVLHSGLPRVAAALSNVFRGAGVG